MSFHRYVGSWEVRHTLGDARVPTHDVAGEAYVWERTYRIDRTDICPNRMDNY